MNRLDLKFRGTARHLAAFALVLSLSGIGCVAAAFSHAMIAHCAFGMSGQVSSENGCCVTSRGKETTLAASHQEQQSGTSVDCCAPFQIAAIQSHAPQSYDYLAALPATLRYVIQTKDAQQVSAPENSFWLPDRGNTHLLHCTFLI
jgi:hypothetical protein